MFHVSLEYGKAEGDLMWDQMGWHDGNRAVTKKPKMATLAVTGKERAASYIVIVSWRD